MSNRLIVVDSDLRAVVRVDPVEGSAAIVGNSTTGALVVVDVGLGAVVRVDPQTGERTIVSVGAE